MLTNTPRSMEETLRSALYNSIDKLSGVKYILRRMVGFDNE